MTHLPPSYVRNEILSRMRQKGGTMIKLVTKSIFIDLNIFAVTALCSTFAWAQNVGDYRSKTSGAWNADSTWEVYNGESWGAPETPPSSSTAKVTIRQGHTVTVTSDHNLTVGGIITGEDASAILHFSGVNIILNSGGVISVLTLLIDDDSDHNIGGPGAITGCTLDIQPGYLRLSDDLRFTGGAIQLVDGSSLDLNSNALTLDGTTLSIGSGGCSVDDYSEGEAGVVLTRGNTTIDQGGNFYVPLQVSSGNTSAWSEENAVYKLVPSPSKGVSPVKRVSKLAQAAQVRALKKTSSGDLAQFYGDIDVAAGATLYVPSGKTLSVNCEYLTVEGTVGGADNTSHFAMDGDENYMSFSNGIVSVSNFDIISEEDTEYIEGTGTFTGSTVNLSTYAHLELSNDLTMNGGTIVLPNGSVLDTYENTLTLNGTTLNIGSGAAVDDYSEGWGLVLTKGNTTIDHAGDFYVPLQVSSGITSAWSEIYAEYKLVPSLSKGVSPVQRVSKLAQATKARRVNKTLSSSLAQFYGDINVAAGAALYVPSGKTLSVNCDYLTVEGTIGGADNTSHFAMDGDENSMSFTNGTVSVSNFDVISEEDTEYIEGTATFTGSTMNLSTYAHLQLSDDFTTNGGIIALPNGAVLDTYGNTLTLNGTTLNIGSGAAIDDYSDVVGLVLTKGSTTIDQGGDFYIPLQVFSGTTSAWCETYVAYKILPGSKSGAPSVGGIARVQPAKSKRRAQVSVLDGLAVFEGDINVSAGATLQIPSGKTLELSYSNIAEAAGSTTLGNIETTWYYDTTGVSFGGLGVWIHSNGSNPGTITVSRTTGAAPTLSGATSIKRYFDISPSYNSGLIADFKFTYAAGELNGAIESGLKLYKSTDGGTSWSKQGGNVNTSTHTITLYGVDSFSRWTAGQAGPVLPTLTNINPGSGAIGSRILLDITGTNFDGGSTVGFSGTGITVNSVVVNSSTDLTVDISISNTAATGSRTVTVTNATGSASMTNGFQVVYPVPTLAGISPNAAHRGDILSVILSGTNFIGGLTSVDFGAGLSADSISVLSASQLRARISVSASASMGSRNVSVTNPGPGGGTATLAGGFSITNPAAAITSVNPSAGGRGVSTSVTITGTGFVQGVTTVNFGTGITVSSIVMSSATKLTANVFVARDATLGSRDITVSNPAPGGGSATLSGGFAVQNPVPTVTNATPGTGVLGQTLAVTVTGLGFLSGVRYSRFWSRCDSEFFRRGYERHTYCF